MPFKALLCKDSSPNICKAKKENRYIYLENTELTESMFPVFSFNFQDQPRGTRLVQSKERATLCLGIMSLSPMLKVEIT